MINEKDQISKANIEQPCSIHQSQCQFKELYEKLKAENQALKSENKNYQTTIQKLNSQSSKKDKTIKHQQQEISELKSKQANHSIRVTKLKKQISNAQQVIEKLCLKKHVAYKNQASYYTMQNEQQRNSFKNSRYQFDKDSYKQSQYRDRYNAVGIQKSSINSTYKLEQSYYLPKQRIGQQSALDGSRKSRKERLLKCKNISDVLKLDKHN